MVVAVAPTILSLIQEYFPEEQWINAQCILHRECPPASPGYPDGCVFGVGEYGCGEVQGRALAFGPFGLLDVCWDPDLNKESPFSRGAWGCVLDPNMNVWMASVIWSKHGWGAWTTCPHCGICDTAPGGAIPHPEGPLEHLSVCVPAVATTGGLPWYLVLAGLGGVLGALVLRQIVKGDANV